MGGKSSSPPPPPPPKETTTTNISEPPAYARKHIEKALKLVGRESQKPKEFYPGQTYVDPAADTLASVGLLRQRALDGNRLQNAAEISLMKTAQGHYLDDSDEALGALIARGKSDMSEDFRNNTLPAITSQFARSGNFNTPMQRDAIADATGELYDSMGLYDASIRGPAFAAERERMMNAARLAPAYASTDYQDISALGRAGAFHEGIEGRALSEDIARHDFEQNEALRRLIPYAQLAYTGASAAGGASTTTATNPAHYNPAYYQSRGPGPLEYLGAGAGLIGAASPLALK